LFFGVLSFSLLEETANARAIDVKQLARLTPRADAAPRGLFHTAGGLFDQGGDGIRVRDIDAWLPATSTTVAPAALAMGDRFAVESWK
jgi:hypothetical protein